MEIVYITMKYVLFLIKRRHYFQWRWTSHQCHVRPSYDVSTYIPTLLCIVNAAFNLGEYIPLRWEVTSNHPSEQFSGPNPGRRPEDPPNSSKLPPIIIPERKVRRKNETASRSNVIDITAQPTGLSDFAPPSPNSLLLRRGTRRHESQSPNRTRRHTGWRFRFRWMRGPLTVGLWRGGRLE